MSPAPRRQPTGGDWIDALPRAPGAQGKSPATLRLYVANLRALAALLEEHGGCLRESLERGDAARVEADAALLRARFPSLPTFRNHVTAVLAYYKYMGLQCALAEPYGRWKAVHEAASRELKARVERNEPSERQDAKGAGGLRFADVVARYREVRDALRAETDPAPREVMMFVVLSAYAHIVPKRADLGAVRIYRRLPRGHQEDHNYVCLYRRAPVLVLNRHKTRSSHGRIVEGLPREFVEDVTWSLGPCPRAYLVTQGASGRPYDKNNSFSKFVIRTFDHHFGKEVGVTYLRHLYINGVSFDGTPISARREIARKMGHSLATQAEYRWV